MAMTMKGEVTLPADRQTVWAKLNDPEVLKACIPGCQTLDKTGENGFSAVVKLKVGPVSATFKGNVELSDFDPPNSYKISGAGEGGIAGFAKGGAVVHLADAEGGGTLLTHRGFRGFSTRNHGEVIVQRPIVGRSDFQLA